MLYPILRRLAVAWPSLGRQGCRVAGVAPHPVGTRIGPSGKPQQITWAEGRETPTFGPVGQRKELLRRKAGKGGRLWCMMCLFVYIPLLAWRLLSQGCLLSGTRLNGDAGFGYTLVR